MARLVGVDLPREKRMAVALTYIYGVGRSRAAEALEATGISPDLRARDLTDDQAIALREWIEANLRVEGDLRREIAMNIKRLIEDQKANANGFYYVRLNINGVWRYIAVDNKLPYSNG